MTSEVLIMTPNAIAMAADSVVTINKKKTYEGVNKLFMLSNKPPMGIMIYHNSNFFNIPMETIIKDFRKKINNTNLRYIADFKEEFDKYLKNVCENEDQIKIFTMDFMLDKFINQVTLKLRDYPNHIKKYMDETTNIDNLTIEKELFEDKLFKSNYLSKIKKLSEEFDHVDIDSELLFRKLFIKRVILDKFIGVVISGFHEDELLPTGLNFKIMQYGNKFKFDDFEGYTLIDNPAIIKPFAQTNSIRNFLDGIDISTYFHLSQYVSKIINDYTNNLKLLVEVNGKLNKKTPGEINEDLKKINDESKQIVKDYIIFTDNFVKKNNNDTVKFVQALPKTELSNLAESLINITSLKIKVKNNIENVGGDIDVAIITKGDGFIWTKRKHYFDKSLNPQFFNRKKYLNK